MSKRSSGNSDSSKQRIDKSDSEHNFANEQPWNIDPSKITDQQQLKQAQDRIDEWVQQLQKDISELLEKNGIEKYNLGFNHPASGDLIMINRGSLLEAAVISKQVYVSMKTQIDKLTGV